MIPATKREPLTFRAYDGKLAGVQVKKKKNNNQLKQTKEKPHMPG